eukprot:jgi/Mesvir1/895/Mv17457-RA.1
MIAHYHFRALGVHRVFKDNEVVIRLCANVGACKKIVKKTRAFLGSVLQDKTAGMLDVAGDLPSSNSSDHLQATATRSEVLQLSTMSSDLEDAAQAVGDGGSLIETVTIGILGSLSLLFMNQLNDTLVVGRERMHDAILRRWPGQALITVSNHVASLDDPLITSVLIPRETLTDARYARWLLCATDRCFQNRLQSCLVRLGKVLPIERGAGLEQDGMRWAIGRLRQGDWVHIFPEGRRSRDGGQKLGPMRRGIGRLVSDLDTPPLIIPFVHTGMQAIQPVGASLLSAGHKVTVLVGDPVDVSDLMATYTRENRQVAPRELIAAVSDRVGAALSRLHAEVQALHTLHVVQGELRYEEGNDAPAAAAAALKAFYREADRKGSTAEKPEQAGTPLAPLVIRHQPGPQDNLELVGDNLTIMGGSESLTYNGLIPPYSDRSATPGIGAERNNAYFYDNARSVWRLAAMAVPQCWLPPVPRSHHVVQVDDGGGAPAGPAETRHLVHSSSASSSSTARSAMRAPDLSSDVPAGSNSSKYEGLPCDTTGDAGLGWHSHDGGHGMCSLGDDGNSGGGIGAGDPCDHLASDAVASMRRASAGARQLSLQHMCGFAAAGVVMYV